VMSLRLGRVGTARRTGLRHAGSGRVFTGQNLSGLRVARARPDDGPDLTGFITPDPGEFSWVKTCQVFVARGPDLTTGQT
jgi:hypothetical protein